jgi:elongation factor G
MKVVIETPAEFQGNVMGSLNQRRGMIIGSHDVGQITAIESEVPLSEMFGYSTTLRSMTQGKANFTMEFSTYKQVPKSILETIEKKNEKKTKTGT